MNTATTWIVKLLWNGVERELFTEISVRSYVLGLQEQGRELGKDFTVKGKVWTC